MLQAKCATQLHIQNRTEAQMLPFHARMARDVDKKSRQRGKGMTALRALRAGGMPGATGNTKGAPGSRPW